MGDPDMCFQICTVEGNTTMVTRRQYQKAALARKNYGMVGQSSIGNFKHMVQFKLLPGYPITVDDVNNFEFIFDPDVPTLKGKTT